MNSVIMIVVSICQIHSKDPAEIVAREQSKCQAYYADCLAKSRAANEMAILSCMAAKPASDLYDKAKATSRSIKIDQQKRIEQESDSTTEAK